MCYIIKDVCVTKNRIIKMVGEDDDHGKMAPTWPAAAHTAPAIAHTARVVVLAAYPDQRVGARSALGAPSSTRYCVCTS